MPEALPCPICNGVMYHYYPQDFWKCQNAKCGKTYFPPDDEEPVDEDIMSCWLEDVYNRPGRKHGGGQRGKKRKPRGKPWMGRYEE